MELPTALPPLRGKVRMRVTMVIVGIAVFMDKISDPEYGHLKVLGSVDVRKWFVLLAALRYGN